MDRRHPAAAAGRVSRALTERPTSATGTVTAAVTVPAPTATPAPTLSSLGCLPRAAQPTAGGQPGKPRLTDQHPSIPPGEGHRPPGRCRPPPGPTGPHSALAPTGQPPTDLWFNRARAFSHRCPLIRSVLEPGGQPGPSGSRSGNECETEENERHPLSENGEWKPRREQKPGTLGIEHRAAGRANPLRAPREPAAQRLVFSCAHLVP